MDDRAERVIERIAGDYERGRSIRRVMEHTGLGFRTFLAGFILGAGFGSGITAYLVREGGEAEIEQPAGEDLQRQPPATLLESISTGQERRPIETFTPPVPQEPASRQVAGPNQPELLPLMPIPKNTFPGRIPEGYERVPTRAAGQWLVPMDASRIDPETVPEGHTLMKRGNFTVLADEQSRQMYEKSGYTRPLERLDTLEPPGQGQGSRRTIRN